MHEDGIDVDWREMIVGAGVFVFFMLVFQFHHIGGLLGLWCRS